MAETKVYHNRNFQIVCCTGLMGMMMVAIIVPAFPKMVEALGVTEQSIGLLITAFTLPSFLFAPLGGILADRFGRKRLLVTSLFLNGIFGGSCVFAPDFNTLLILRVLQGMGSALGGSVAGAIIGDIFSGHRRVEAMAINTTVMYVGYIVYPVIGGALAGIAWNYSFLPFLTAIPLGLTALIFLHCPEPQSKQGLKDYLRDALRYVKSLKALWLFSATILTYVLLYGGYLVYFGLLLGSHFHASPVTIGLFISVLGVITAAASLQVGRLGKRFSVVSLIIGAFALYALAMAIIPAMPNLWFCLLPTIFFAIAHGLNLPSQRVIAAGVAPLEYRASFMSLQGTMIMLGMTVGPPIMGLVFSLTSLNITFLIAVPIALIVPVMAMIIGKGKLSVT
jgi:ACDE family multidrug resistance protein